MHRASDLFIRAPFLPGLLEETSKGLDYGSALGSILEGSGLDFDAIDPLMDEYNKICKMSDRYSVDTDKKYDWILCVNVVDHDQNPKKIIDDIKTKLNKGGRLYFHVNFDDNLSPAHCMLFNEHKVNELMTGFKQENKSIVRDNDYLLYHFYATYII